MKVCKRQYFGTMGVSRVRDKGGSKAVRYSTGKAGTRENVEDEVT